MKIKKMTATFGALDRAVLELGDGLTVITAPNESGKSTWCGFLKAMLYGIDTKERDKAGFLADKNRYQPWSGAPMQGELQVEWQGKDITIRRFPAKNNPFGGFEAVYTATGDPVPGLTSSNVGETLTGAGREVFLRSAFVAQSGSAINHSQELEARIAALATSGQEDVSHSAAQRTLKDWHNRRRANRANGLVPRLEEELLQAQQALSGMDATRRHRQEAEGQLAQLTEEMGQLKGDLEAWDRIDAHRLNQRYGQAQLDAEAAQAELDALSPPYLDMESWTAQDARAWAARQEADHRAALEDQEKALEYQRQLEGSAARPARLAVAGAILLAVAAVVLAFLGWREILTFDPNICLYLLVAACACLIGRNRLVSNAFQKAQAVDIPDVPEPADWQTMAQRHTDYLSHREQLLREVDHRQQRVADLAAQGATPFDTLELIHPPARPRGALEGRLRAAELDRARLRDAIARAEGSLQQMGDPIRLEEEIARLEGELATRSGELAAIDLAMAALDEANGMLRERFSPALNEAAGEIFSALTGGKWPRLSLARDFTAQATGQDDLLPRTSLALSVGTADQLYLAVRLAICRLTLPHAPVVLDDALTFFDDSRVEQALDVLLQLSRERQVLLFTCHRRESLWAEAQGIPSITL